MRCIYFLFMILAVAIAEEKYQLKTQNFNIQEVAADKDKLRSYLQCFIDEIPCEGFAAELKKNAREAIETSCSKCTDEQKHYVSVLLPAFAKEVPEDFEKFKAFYDPQGKHLSKLSQAAAHA